MQPSREAIEDYQRARALQTGGDIAAAAAAYRRVGPGLAEILAQRGAAGDVISGPHFLIIGPGRAGTTWFKRRLSFQPQVFMLTGEQSYFSADAATPPEAYIRRFAGSDASFKRPAQVDAGAVAASERIYGEKSPSYLAMDDAGLDLCAALFPEVKLICTVREPVDRAWSHLKHLKPSYFEAALKAVARGEPSATLDEVVAQGRYEAHLARWARRFRPEQMLLIDFRRLASEPADVYAETLAHIGAKPTDADVDLTRVGRPTVEMEMPGEVAAYLAAAYAGDRFDIDWLQQVMATAAAEADTRLRR